MSHSTSYVNLRVGLMAGCFQRKSENPHSTRQTNSICCWGRITFREPLSWPMLA